MIKKINNYFKLDTKNSSYIIFITKFNHVVCNYYGNYIFDSGDLFFTNEKYNAPTGTSVNYSEEDYNYVLDNLSLEVSTPFKGDFKEPSIIIDNGKNFILDLVYQDYEIHEADTKMKTLPSIKGNLPELVLHLKDLALNIFVDLIYVVDEENDVILRRTLIKNNMENPIILNKVMSMQLELIGKDFEIISLYGGWGFEGQKAFNKLDHGIFINDSKTGNSSNRHNPFFMLKEKEATYNNGITYAFNLIYSSNHFELIEQSSFNKIRIQNGINPYCFKYTLNVNEEFETPFSVLTFSSNGINGSSQNMHNFIHKHILREQFSYKPAPILINNWEATYMKFKQSTLKKIIRAAKDLKLEMFVLDDGWFGRRTDDFKGLGDYDVNKKKLPSGLKGISKYSNKHNLKFGLWFEPEMVNENSKLFETHPNWAIQDPLRPSSKGRHQLILDLTNKDVQDYIITNVNHILDTNNIEYVKWDMNRHFSDVNSSLYHGGEVLHRYIVGLYRIFNEIILTHPNVYFEGCASGGNRFDLGILSYFDQIWTSDDTDAFERISIQSGYALGYPLKCLSNHVSASPSHSVLRNTPLDTRFNVALFGSLGFELDLSTLKPIEKKAIKKMVNFYKEHRKLIVNGDFYQLSDIKKDGYALWAVVSKDKEEALIGYFNSLQKMNPSLVELKIPNLNKDYIYNLTVRKQEHNIHMFGGLINQILPFRMDERGFIVNTAANYVTLKGEIEEYNLSGSALMSGALKLNNEWCGTGIGDGVRVLGDFGSRVYYVKKI